MHIIIGGSGQLGSEIADLLSEQPDHDIVVVDLQARALDHLGSAFNGETLVGDITDRDVLERAGVDHADGMLAVTRSDNANLMAVQTAQHLYGVPRAVARLFNPQRETTYQRLGVRYVSATGILAKLFLNEFRDSDFPHHVRHETGDVETVDLWLGDEAHDMTVAEVEEVGRIRIGAITRGQRVRVAHADDRVRANDVVTASMRRRDRRHVKTLLATPEELSDRAGA